MQSVFGFKGLESGKKGFDGHQSVMDENPKVCLQFLFQEII